MRICERIVGSVWWDGCGGEGCEGVVNSLAEVTEWADLFSILLS